MPLKVKSYTLKVSKPGEATQTHRLWCGWCDTSMDDKGPLTEEEKSTGKVSHGMCPKCVEKKNAEIDDLFGRE